TAPASTATPAPARSSARPRAADRASFATRTHVAFWCAIALLQQRDRAPEARFGGRWRRSDAWVGARARPRFGRGVGLDLRRDGAIRAAVAAEADDAGRVVPQVARREE